MRCQVCYTDAKGYKCSRCGFACVSYCSRGCQVKDYKYHKKVCVKSDIGLSHPMELGGNALYIHDIFITLINRLEDHRMIYLINKLISEYAVDNLDANALYDIKNSYHYIISSELNRIFGEIPQEWMEYIKMVQLRRMGMATKDVLNTHSNQLSILNYDQIKRDVYEFKNIVCTYGLIGYCALGSLLLEICLKEHGVRCEMVKGYLITNDTHWVLHIWNKIYLSNGETKQIDIVYNPLKNAGFTMMYTLELKDKWESLIDTDEEQADYEHLLGFYDEYTKFGSKNAIKYLAKRRDRSCDIVWRAIFKKATRLKTFEKIPALDVFFP